MPKQRLPTTVFYVFKTSTNLDPKSHTDLPLPTYFVHHIINHYESPFDSLFEYIE